MRKKKKKRQRNQGVGTGIHVDSQRHMGNPRQMKGRNKPAFTAEQRGLAVRSTYVRDDELS